MITPKIKALFQFIEYLHSNIDNFRKYDEMLNTLHLLNKERQQIRPQNNFKDKLKYDEVQAEIIDKFNVIQDNILQPIKAKANELKICDLNRTETLWNWNSTEIHELKENFSKDDLPEIFNHKSKYIEYREKTKGEAFFGLRCFFDDLDELLKTLFEFFKEPEQQNEFEAFETKGVQVNDLSEAVKLFQLGYKKITLPNTILNPSSIQQQPNIEPLPTQQNEKGNLNDNSKPNNFTVSTIEDWLFEFKEQKVITEPHYTNLVNALAYYFENGVFPELDQTIKVGRVNKKLLGWHLNRIFHSEGKGIEIDLLNFAKRRISTFQSVDFEENDTRKGNLYKYFTTKTK